MVAGGFADYEVGASAGSRIQAVGSVSASKAQARRWYVAQTLPRKESWAIQHLRHQGFSTFFPRFRQQVRRKTGAQLCLVPVFPGYVFVAFDPNRDHWSAIRGTRGVRCLVGSKGGLPQSVPRPVMDHLFTRCREEVMINLVSDLKPGDMVQITSGPLSRRIAEVHSLTERGRVRLLFDLLGCSNSLDVDISCLAPVI